MKRMNRIFKRCLAMASALMLAVSESAYASAAPAEVSSVLTHTPEISKSGGWIHKEMEPTSSDARSAKPYLNAVSLPATYNSRSLGYIDRVEDQGNHNLCWAFVQNTLAAINVKKDEGKSVNYSEMHMAYALSSAYNNASGYVREVDDGGNYEISLAYLARGSGMVTESDDPYVKGDFPDRSAAKTDSFFSNGYLEEAPILFDCTTQQIKGLIYEYGAVGASIFYDDYFYNSYTNVYNCTTVLNPNHGVALVGWNDNTRCFLALNSWGTDWGDNGYFWISYDDKVVGDNVFATDYSTAVPPYDGIRSYNNFGWVAYESGSKGQSLYYGTTYDTGDAQTLEGIGTYTVGANTKLEIYVNPYDGDGKTASKFKKVHTETFVNPGYYHISFEAPVYLYGSKFNIKIKTSSTLGDVPYRPYQINYTDYLENSVFQPGRSFVGSNNGAMKLLEEEGSLSSLKSSGKVWSMHAYTNSDLKVEIDQAKIEQKGDGYQVTLSQSSSRSYTILRNGMSLALYSDAACNTLAPYTLSAGTYYINLQNGTHIRRNLTVTMSTKPATWSLDGIIGAEKRSDGYYVYSSAATYFPNISYTGSSWGLYALPNGVGKIGIAFAPKRRHSLLYLRIVANDGIAAYDYPLHVYSSYSDTVGYEDWSHVSNWANKSMNHVVKNGILQGTNGMLNPKKNMNRAEAAAILLRVAGIESSFITTDYALVYGDVAADAWYAKSVGAASFIGLISGHRNPGYRCFSPTSAVTREQFAVMMLQLQAYMEGVEYQTYLNRDLAAAKRWVAERGFADLPKIGSWAYDAVCVALYYGVFDGASVNGRLYVNPKKNITREQAAVMICNSNI